jgi:recombination protein RecA
MTTKTDRPRDLQSLRDKHGLLEDPFAGDALSTGSRRFDILLNGGLRRGQMSEFFGAPGGGKSTLAQKACGACIQAGGRVAYVDLEHSLDPDWTLKNGFDLNHEACDVYHPVFQERVFDLLEDGLHFYDLMVVDSVGAFIPMSEFETDIETSTYGAVARINARGFRRLMVRFDQALQENDRHLSHIIFVNQVRANVGGSQYVPERTTGGKAMPHFMSNRLEMRRIKNQVVDDKTELTETLHRIKVVKSRHARFGSTAQVTISSAYGLDVAWEMLEEGMADGSVVQKGGGYFEFLEGTKVVHKVRGKDAAKAYLRGET